jgi:phosphoribosylamine--glycine ligase
MGAYSPAPVVTPELEARILREVLEPTVQGMALDGLPYSGFLYAGIMIDAQGNPKVLEFNCRFGDPETQPIMLRLQSDLVGLLEAGVDGRLDQVGAAWDTRVALGVVLAAGGYPGEVRSGDVIEGLDTPQPDYAKVFQAGTALNADGKTIAAGGRVLCVTALGTSVHEAQQRAYAAVDSIHFEGGFCRRDIGWRALNR